MEDLINEQPEQDIEHCANCIHAADSEDICILRKCKYAIAELKNCYEPKQTERKRGKWIYHHDWYLDDECPYECDQCGMGSDVDYDFCPGCGADLRGGQDAEPARAEGTWEERKVMTIDESKGIEEWQSCKCSNCGRYDTRPYLYHFEKPNFCSWCGAEME